MPAIVQLRAKADEYRAAELAKAKARLAKGEDPQLVLAHLARALTNKFTHAPSSALQQADHDGNADLLKAARKLFNLNDDD